jgi:hypothetical protein
MADIWLTAAAQDAYSGLLDTAPAQAHAVSEAINDIVAHPGQPIDLPGSPPAEPFLAKEPRHPDAPAVIYRRSTPGEQGDWLVVSLMNRANYRAAREAQRELASYPTSVQTLVEHFARGAIRHEHETAMETEPDTPTLHAVLYMDVESAAVLVDAGHDTEPPTANAVLSLKLSPAG